MNAYNQLQIREVFHLEFLRRLGRKLKTGHYAVKGGANLRFFFKSFRYSEDMDLDARGIGVTELQETVMKILEANAFQDNLKPFGIARIVPPDIAKAKQTETTQRFKIHLLLSSGEDLFTKIEFSKRGFSGNIVVEAVDNTSLRAYQLTPILAPHYDIHAAVAQKTHALADRSAVQARDIFDLYVLSSQYTGASKNPREIDSALLTKAYERIFEVEFDQFRDTVVSYLAAEDQTVYGEPRAWEEIRLKTAQFIEELKKEHA